MEEEKIEVPIGFPIHFDYDLHLQAVEQMIASDEVEIALKMLEQVPGYYRENPYHAAVKLKKELHKKFVTPAWYSSFNDGSEFDIEGKLINKLHRGLILLHEMKELNAKGIEPTIVEIGPGNFWLPFGLLANGIKFKYKAVTVNQEELRKAKEFDSKIQWVDEVKGYLVFIAFEIIEHLWFDEELYQYSCKEGDPDMVMLSTPNSTYIGVSKDWRANDLGHLRTYTKHEFAAYGAKHWPYLSWSMAVDHVNVLVGKKP